MSSPSGRCFYFGCWNKPGHFLAGPDGCWPGREFARLEYYGEDRAMHLDGTLAPRRMRGTDELCWRGMGDGRIEYRSDECPEGQFLLHVLDTGYTAIQWWDRRQGDRRGACNSTILLEGQHTAEEMLVALQEHFPHVLANLTKAGVALVEVKRP